MLIIWPGSKTFANGMCAFYSYDDYDEEIMKGVMARHFYDKYIEDINNHIFSRYPCIGCQGFAYLCCLCTAGFSCIIPYLQVRDAERACKRYIR